MQRRFAPFDQPDLTRLLIPAALLLAVPLVGLAPPALPVAVLGATVAFGYSVLAFRSLGAGLAIFVGLTFLDRAGDTVGTGITFGRVFGGFLAVTWLFVLLRRHEDTPVIFRDAPVYSALLLVFAGWVVASGLWAVDLSTAVSSGVRLSQGLIVIPIVYSAVRSKKHLTWVLVVFCLSSTVLAIDTLGRAAAGARITGGFDDPNEFAAVLVPSAIFAAAAVLAPVRPAVRIAAVVVMLVDLYALLHTESSGGLVALVAAIVAGVVIGGSIRRRAVGVALVAGAFALIFFTTVGSVSGIYEGGNSRENLWRVTIAVSEDHPVVGVGAGNFPVVEPQYAYRTIPISRPDLILQSYVSHNTYLHVLAEYGIVGLSLFGGVIGGALLLGLRAARRFAAFDELLLEIMARAVLVGTVGLLTAYFFLSSQYEKHLWIMLGLCASLDAVARARTSSS